MPGNDAEEENINITSGAGMAVGLVKFEQGWLNIANNFEVYEVGSGLRKKIIMKINYFLIHECQGKA